jgi:alpha-beta hydrolase superfamily lysophospholipase
VKRLTERLRVAAALAAAAVVFAGALPAPRADASASAGVSAAKKKPKKGKSRKRKPAKKKTEAQKADEPTVPRAPDPNRVSLQTSDGVVLVATWRPVPGRPDAPAVLLVHDFSRDRRMWEGIAPEFAARGLATLAIDLRAHGESTRKAAGGPPIHLSPRLLSDSNAFPQDVKAACEWLRTRSRGVGVMGLSLGGNLAVLATASRWADTAVSVSANVERLPSLAGSRPTKARSLLALASQDDTARADSASKLADAAEPPKKAIVFPGSAHNLSLLGENPEAKRAAYDWLVKELGAQPPPAAPVPEAAAGVEPTPVAAPGGSR